MGAPQPVGVRMVREAEQRRVRIRIRDVVGVDPRDVDDHEVGRVDPLRGDETMVREQRLELPAQKEVDPDEQDPGHAEERR